MNIKRISSVMLIVALTTTSISLSSCSHKHSFGETKTSNATCLSEGYSYHLCNSCGYTEYWDIVPSTDHSFTNWKNDIRIMKKVAECDYCGLHTEDSNYTAPVSIPQLYIYGNPNGAIVPVHCRYETTIESTFYGTVKLDANESNAYFKKDYDIEIYTDSSNKTPMDVTFTEAMGSYPVYTVKSEYADCTSIRNLAASELWYNVIRTRDHIQPQLQTLPFLGADHGFPIIFYTNDNFKGIYNLCLPNDKNLFGLEGNKARLIYTYSDFGEFDFRYFTGANDHVPCTIVYPENDNGDYGTQDSFLKLFDFVNGSTVNEFKNGISEMLDVDAAIDYLICVYLFGADDNIVEFCNWVSFDGKKYTPSMYNLTHTFGIDDHGYLRSADTTIAPYIENGVLRSGTTYPLWEKLCAAFPEKISERYSYLRKNVLTDNAINEVFSKHLASISPDIYEAEFEEYNDKNLCDGPKTAEDITKWYSEKCGITDKILLK